MGVAAIVIFSIIALFAFGAPGMMGPRQPMGEDQFVNMTHVIARPERKSVIVDADGIAHRTADNTQMTKRDRTRFGQPVKPAPIVVTNAAPAVTPVPAPAPENRTAQPEIVAADIKSEPVPQTGYRYQEEQMTPPAVPPAVGGETAAEPSMNEKIEDQLGEDTTLSEPARLTLRATYKEGSVILRGVVSDEKEKTYLAEKAKAIPGVQTVENQLHTLNEQTELNNDPAAKKTE